METLRLENTPITYYVDDRANGDWLVFVHAAFVDHRMFEKQFNYFSGKYNLLAVDILGHGNSCNAKKGDTIEKMSYWIDLIFQKHNIPPRILWGYRWVRCLYRILRISTRAKFYRLPVSADTI